MGWAADLLGVKSTDTAVEIRAAYHKRLLELHPDTGGDGADPAQIQRLKEACDLMLASLSDEPCPECKGKGKILAQRGWATTLVECPECKGRGWPE